MINLFTDPHLGADPKTNTSASSGKALSTKVSQVALGLAEQYKGTNLIMAGDLFHKSHNKESTIAEGIALANACSIVVGGNHDSTSRADDKSSLELIASICPSILSADIAKPEIHFGLEFDSGEVVTVIPHQANQEFFDKAVVMACKGEMKDLVILHCNYNNPFTDGVDTALNLSPDQAEQLLKYYRYIVIGHEHTPRRELEGRLVALGNTFPTSFSDLSNKYVWHYDNTKADPWSRTQVWDKETYFLKLDAAEIYNLPESEFELEEDSIAPQFVDIYGQLDAEHMPELAARIAMIWDKWQPFMVRNDVNVRLEETTSLMEEGYRIEDFTSRIRDGLVDAPDMLALFNEKLAKVGE